MGWRPAEVRECTPADFEDAMEGWLDAQGVEPGPDLSDEAIADLDDLMAQYPDTVH